MPYPNNAKYDPTDFQTSLSYYMHTVEELYKTVEDKQRTSDDPSYSISVQILMQIYQQMKRMMERRQISNPLAELLLNEDIVSFNQIIEEDLKDQLKKNKQEKVYVADNSKAPPPWKPKK